jgi:hypothetical protein
MDTNRHEFEEGSTKANEENEDFFWTKKTETLLLLLSSVQKYSGLRVHLCRFVVAP